VEHTQRGVDLERLTEADRGRITNPFAVEVKLSRFARSSRWAAHRSRQPASGLSGPSRRALAFIIIP
jgi:hypothetical protein